MEFGAAVLAEGSMKGVLGLAACAESPSLERSGNRERLCCAGVKVELVAALALKPGHLVLVELPFSFWRSDNGAAAPWAVESHERSPWRKLFLKNRYLRWHCQRVKVNGCLRLGFRVTNLGCMSFLFW